jgi:hypothetical protein
MNANLDHWQKKWTKDSGRIEQKQPIPIPNEALLAKKQSQSVISKIQTQLKLDLYFKIMQLVALWPFFYLYRENYGLLTFLFLFSMALFGVLQWEKKQFHSLRCFPEMGVNIRAAIEQMLHFLTDKNLKINCALAMSYVSPLIIYFLIYFYPLSRSIKIHQGLFVLVLIAGTFAAAFWKKTARTRMEQAHLLACLAEFDEASFRAFQIASRRLQRIIYIIVAFTGVLLLSGVTWYYFISQI